MLPSGGKARQEGGQEGGQKDKKEQGLPSPISLPSVHHLLLFPIHSPICYLQTPSNLCSLNLSTRFLSPQKDKKKHKESKRSRHDSSDDDDDSDR